MTLSSIHPFTRLAPSSLNSIYLAFRHKRQLAAHPHDHSLDPQPGPSTLRVYYSHTQPADSHFDTMDINKIPPDQLAAAMEVYLGADKGLHMGGYIVGYVYSLVPAPFRASPPPSPSLPQELDTAS